ncbi:MAG: hypothetical protein J6A83_09035 [Clostridia bacterium]|nr:hypothetical protein [Clostridia bacterium]
MANYVPTRQTRLYVFDISSYLSCNVSSRYCVEASLVEDYRDFLYYCYYLVDKKTFVKKLVLKISMADLERQYGHQSTRNSLSEALTERWIQTKNFNQDLADI